MQNKADFSFWLEFNKLKTNGEPLKDSSIYKYVHAIDTISKDMMAEGVINRNIYKFADVLGLEQAINAIKENKNFNIKNDTGNNMYSVALEHYKEFIQNRYGGQFHFLFGNNA